MTKVLLDQSPLDWSSNNALEILDSVYDTILSSENDTINNDKVTRIAEEIDEEAFTGYLNEFKKHVSTLEVYIIFTEKLSILLANGTLNCNCNRISFKSVLNFTIEILVGSVMEIKVHKRFDQYYSSVCRLIERSLEQYSGLVKVDLLEKFACHLLDTCNCDKELICFISNFIEYCGVGNKLKDCLVEFHIHCIDEKVSKVGLGLWYFYLNLKKKSRNSRLDNKMLSLIIEALVQKRYFNEALTLIKSWVFSNEGTAFDSDCVLQHFPMHQNLIHVLCLARDVQISRGGIKVTKAMINMYSSYDKIRLLNSWIMTCPFIEWRTVCVQFIKEQLEFLGPDEIQEIVNTLTNEMHFEALTGTISVQVSTAILYHQQLINLLIFLLKRSSSVSKSLKETITSHVKRLQMKIQNIKANVKAEVQTETQLEMKLKLLFLITFIASPSKESSVGTNFITPNYQINSTLTESQAETIDSIQTISTSTEIETILKKKDDLKSHLLELKQTIETTNNNNNNNNDKTTETEIQKSKLILVENRVQQLNTIGSLLKSSYKALILITSIPSNLTEFISNESELETMFEQINMEHEFILKNYLNAAFISKKEGDNLLEKIKLGGGIVVSSKNNSVPEEGTQQNFANNIMDKFDGAVDKLEDELNRNVNAVDEQKKKGKIEAVVKVDDADDIDVPDLGIKNELEMKSLTTYSDSSKIINNSTDIVGLSNGITNSLINISDTSVLRNSSTPSTKSDISKPKPRVQFSVKAPKVIDSENNIFILSRSADYTRYYEDTGLFWDFIMIICVSFILGFVFDKLKLPPFFGYMLSGTILGPPYYDKIERIVQMETIGIFGILVMLFVLGLEFPTDQIKRFLRITIMAGGTIVFLCILSVVLVGVYIFGFGLPQTIFLGSLLSLSSTSVVIKCMDGEKESKNSKATLGILVLQDILVGLILAILPVLANPTSGSLLFSVVQVIAYNGMFMLLSVIVGRFLNPAVTVIIAGLGSADLQLVGVLCYGLSFVILADHFSISIEVGCFIAGVVLGNKNLNSSDGKIQLLERIEAIRDIFSCVFFASIGFHVYPSFLMSQLPLLFALTMGIMIFKTIMSYLVLHYGFNFTKTNAMLVGMGISQVSEFAFVMCSRAKSLQLINRNLYYLIIGATSLSLIVTPFIWKLMEGCSVQSLVSGGVGGGSGGGNNKNNSAIRKDISIMIPIKETQDIQKQKAKYHIQVDKRSRDTSRDSVNGERLVLHEYQEMF